MSSQFISFSRAIFSGVTNPESCLAYYWSYHIVKVFMLEDATNCYKTE